MIERRTAGCLGLALVFVIIGTLGAGIDPRDPVVQVGAGALIVAGFGVVFICFRD